MISLKNSKIKFITTRHEQAAAFMADGYARVSGKPAVCLGTLGPGATNLITGVANGNTDLSPMIVLTGQGDIQRLHKESHQIIDVVKIFEPVTKWTKRISDAHSIPEIIRKASKIAQSERTGATHIELPENIAKTHTNMKPLPVTRLPHSQANPNDIKRATEMIEKAKKPIILAGNGCIRKNNIKNPFRKFTKLTGISVAQTMMAKGMLPISDPHNLFTIGLSAKDHVSYAFDDADLVITIGYGMVEYSPNKWNQRNDKKIIHIDVIKAEVDNNYSPDIELVGDIALILEQLNSTCDNIKPFSDKIFKRYRNNMWKDIEEFKDDNHFPMYPQKILWDIKDVVGKNGLVFCDVGAHKMWTARYYQCDEPNTCHITNGFCSMGFAMPAAIGARLACCSGLGSCANKKIVAICGDGAFMMNVQDLETAVRCKLPIVITVWNNQRYGLIKWKEDDTYGKSYGNEFGNIDFVKLAESIGAIGCRVEKASSFKDCLKEACKSKNKPVVIDIAVEDRENNELSKHLEALKKLY